MMKSTLFSMQQTLSLEYLHQLIEEGFEEESETIGELVTSINAWAIAEAL